MLELLHMLKTFKKILYCVTRIGSVSEMGKNIAGASVIR
jgi:hypothetical protein